jgi:hypothetical protein
MKQFGSVISCIILKDKGKSRGFGFVTFSHPEVAEEVCRLRHKLRGKEFGCNLIMPNKEARSQQVDKKSRKVYIKSRDKQTLVKSEVFMVFSRFGEIADITILKESKERSGFITFEYKEAVDLLMKNPEVPYQGGIVTCEPCLSRKEIKKQKNPAVNQGHSAKGDVSINSAPFAEQLFYGYQEPYEEPYNDYGQMLGDANYRYEDPQFMPPPSQAIKPPTPGLPKRKTKKETYEFQTKMADQQHDQEELSGLKPVTWPAAHLAPCEANLSPAHGAKPKYFIEVRDVSNTNNLKIPELEMSNSENNSAKQIKEEISKDKFDKSPRHSTEENQGKHFLNVPNLQGGSIHRSDNVALPPKNKLTDMFESSSIKEPMITSGQLNKLFLSDEEKGANANKVASQQNGKNSSKKEMLSSRASRSNSQEFAENKKAQLNYRINQEKPSSDRRRSYRVDMLMPPPADSDIRRRQRSLNEYRTNSPMADHLLALRVPDKVRSFNGHG